MTEREAVWEYLGDPSLQEFDTRDFLGRYGGLVNAVGLRHRGLVASGSQLYHEISQAYGEEFDRWALLLELSNWCAEFTNTQEAAREVQGSRKRYKIEKGTILVGASRYYCVPRRRRRANGLRVVNDGTDKGALYGGGVQ